jgi:hypoxanthine phosphoribosyltransferase
MEFEVPTWNQIYAMLLSLAVNINKSGFKPELIVGVSRGGLIPARVLADLLGNTNLTSVGAELYSGVSKPKIEPTLTYPVSASVDKRKVLVVDEVADTGKSLRLVREHLAQRGAEEVRIATVYIKPCSTVKPDYWVKETRKWIVFPWEIRETIHKIIQQTGEKGKCEESIARLIKSGVSAKLIKRFMKETEEEKC